MFIGALTKHEISVRINRLMILDVAYIWSLILRAYQK